MVGRRNLVVGGGEGSEDLVVLRDDKCGALGKGVVDLIDEFQDELAGLVMAEAEFKTPDLLAAFPMPDFAFREVTDDPRFTGGYLSTNGLPRDFEPIRA
jgi:hypothetical protein